MDILLAFLALIFIAALGVVVVSDRIHNRHAHFRQLRELILALRGDVELLGQRIERALPATAAVPAGREVAATVRSVVPEVAPRPPAVETPLETVPAEVVSETQEQGFELCRDGRTPGAAPLAQAAPAICRRSFRSPVSPAGSRLPLEKRWARFGTGSSWARTRFRPACRWSIRSPVSGCCDWAF